MLKQFQQMIDSTHWAVPIHEPEVVSERRGRPRLTHKAKRSTKRDPSSYEITEEQVRKDAKRQKKDHSVRFTRETKTARDSDHSSSSSESGSSSYAPEVDQSGNNGEFEDLPDDPLAIDSPYKQVTAAKIEAEGVCGDASVGDKVVKEEKDRETFDDGTEDGKDGKDGVRDNEVEVISVGGPSITTTHVATKRLRPIKASHKGKNFQYTPEFLQQFIQKVTNVPADGNCVFHAVAISINPEERYQQLVKNSWFQVRKDRVREFELHSSSFYERLCGGPDMAKMVYDQICVSNPKEKITSHKWLSREDMGPVVANTYQRPIIFLSQNCSDCLTYLPNRSGPEDPVDKSPIILVFTNHSHWMVGHFKSAEEAPYPPVPNWWKKHSRRRAHAWMEELQPNFSLWMTLIKGKGRQT